MFDSVTHPSVRGRFGTGAVLSVALHGLALGVALLISAPSDTPTPAVPILKFFVPQAPRVSAPSAQAPAAPAHPRTSHHPIALHPKDAVVGKRMEPPELAGVDSGQTPDLDVPDTVGGTGVSGSVSTLGSGVGSGVDSGPVVFSTDRGMTLPTLISGATPTYTREALLAGVQGTIVARCVITAEGQVTHCRIVKGLPYLDRSVLRTLEGQRYTPVTLNGQPIAVDYVFKLRMVLPGR